MALLLLHPIGIFPILIYLEVLVQLMISRQDLVLAQTYHHQNRIKNLQRLTLVKIKIEKKAVFNEHLHLHRWQATELQLHHLPRRLEVPHLRLHPHPGDKQYKKLLCDWEYVVLKQTVR